MEKKFRRTVESTTLMGERDEKEEASPFSFFVGVMIE